jgi:general secretion pathway protein J
MKHLQKNSGFTAVEIMIALTIMAVISSLIYGSFARTFEVRELVTQSQQRYHSIRVALERMAREISMAFVYDCRQLDTPTGERRQQTLFKVEHEGKFDRLIFTSFAHLRLYKDVHESDQNVLSYFGEDDPKHNSQNNLMRREKARIDGQPEEGGETQVLCPDIKELKFTFWDEVKNDWVDDWDCSRVERQNRLPRLVRITVATADGPDQQLKLSTIARIFTLKPLLNWIKPSS